MFNRRHFLAATAICALPSAVRAETAAPMSLVASFSILADLVTQVAGAQAKVRALVGPDGDAHVFSPSPDDARLVAGAGLVVINGLGLEGWMPRLLQAAATKAPIVTATKGIAPLRMEEGGHVGDDPHAWQNVANAKIYVANIRDGLALADPANASAYADNARAYLAVLDQLDGEVRGAIAAIPAKNRRIITSHDAFGYFGKAYGMQFIAPQGVSTESEPSARDVARIIRQIRAEKIPAVFLENMTDPRLIERMAKESGAKIGGKVYSDSLSGPDGPAPTYVAMMRNNIAAFAAALVG